MATPFAVQRAGGEEGEEYRFANSLFLVFVNRVLAVTLAVGAMAGGGESGRRGLRMVAPWHSYAIASASNVIATTCQYEALKWVSFPVQTLGKCARPVPVMVWTLVLFPGVRRYRHADYAGAALVMLGCLLFLGGASGATARSAAAEGKDDQETTFMGLTLMAGYLSFDGLTSTWQEKLFRGYEGVSEYNQMLYVGLFSLAGCFLALLLSPTEAQVLPPGPGEVPELWAAIMALALSSALGAVFILATIREFGALVFSLVMTTRQLVSIVCSALLFGHPLTLVQILGAGMVFGSLFQKTLTNNAERKRAKAKLEERLTV